MMPLSFRKEYASAEDFLADYDVNIKNGGLLLEHSEPVEARQPAKIILVIDRTTYAMAAAVEILAAFISGLIARRRIDQLDQVSVLKTRE